MKRRGCSAAPWYSTDEVRQRVFASIFPGLGHLLHENPAGKLGLLRIIPIEFCANEPDMHD